MTPANRKLRPPWWLVVPQGVLTLGLVMTVLGGFDGWELLGFASGSVAFVLNLITIRQWRRNQGVNR